MTHMCLLEGKSPFFGGITHLTSSSTHFVLCALVSVKTWLSRGVQLTAIPRPQLNVVFPMLLGLILLGCDLDLLSLMW